MSTISRADVAAGDPGDHRPDPVELATRPGASPLEPVTGPLPVVDLDDGHLHVTTRREVTIVSIDGGLDHDLSASILPSFADVVGTAKAVVVELDHVTLLDPPRCLAASSPAGSPVAWCSTAGQFRPGWWCSTASPTPSRRESSRPAATAPAGRSQADRSPAVPRRQVSGGREP